MSLTTGTTAWIPSTKSFGARLALVRWRMGWNVKEAATACGLSESNWRGWELDGRLPHKLNDVATKIAHTSGVNKYWLLDGEGDPSDYKATDSKARNVLDLTSRRRHRVTRPSNRSDQSRPRNRKDAA